MSGISLHGRMLLWDQGESRACVEKAHSSLDLIFSY
jgi:hypothetical protein